MMTFEIDRETGKIKSLLKTPYFGFIPSAVVRPDGDGYDLSQMTESPKQQTLVNVKGVPMQLSLIHI